jgi:hypothetical protein
VFDYQWVQRKLLLPCSWPWLNIYDDVRYADRSQGGRHCACIFADAELGSRVANNIYSESFQCLMM